MRRPFGDARDYSNIFDAEDTKPSQFGCLGEVFVDLFCLLVWSQRVTDEGATHCVYDWLAFVNCRQEQVPVPATVAIPTVRKQSLDDSYFDLAESSQIPTWVRGFGQLGQGTTSKRHRRSWSSS